MFCKVAKGFTRRVKPEDRQDFLHDLLLTMRKVKDKYDAIGKELTEAGLIRVACYAVAQYWRMKYRRINGTDCGRCSNEQRRKCKEKDLYRECPKAVKIESLDKLIQDSEGNQIELYQMIADDNAVDITARLEARFILQSYPHRFVRIAYKKSMRVILLPPVKETTFTSIGGKPYKKDYHLSNVFQIFSDVISERVKNLLQDLTSASVSQIGARLWAIEYQATTHG